MAYKILILRRLDGSNDRYLKKERIINPSARFIRGYNVIALAAIFTRGRRSECVVYVA